MNTVEISVTPTEVDYLACVSIEGRYDNAQFNLYTEEVERAREDGTARLLELIRENAGRKAINILEGAVRNQSTVYLDGDEISLELLDAPQTRTP